MQVFNSDEKYYLANAANNVSVALVYPRAQRVGLANAANNVSVALVQRCWIKEIRHRRVARLLALSISLISDLNLKPISAH